MNLLPTNDAWPINLPGELLYPKLILLSINSTTLTAHL